MDQKYKVISLIGVVAIAFAVGRYSVPESVKTEVDKTHVDEKKEREKEETDTTRRTIKKEITHPDGSKETTTIDEENTKKKQTNAISEKNKDTSVEKKEVIASKGGRLTVSALAGAKVQFTGPLEPIYGGMVSKEILGPISVGAFGLSNGIGGVAVGVSF